MSGRVYLVGAGPGSPGLLTARALQLIATADVILYDRLIPAAALDGARADAELLFVGKEGGGESVPQEQTQELLVERARKGLQVVRLKGGDPFVFGRGGEEALALRAAGVPFEVVPGVTAGVAACAYAGIPVTHRGLASAVAFVTGHAREDREPAQVLDWDALAAFPGTLVFYMSVRTLPDIVASLIAAGRPPGEPAAVVEAGTLARQRTVTAALATIAAAAAAERVRAPAVIVVGGVAALAEQLAWIEPLPLRGRTVAVTRARAQASALARRLEALGAEVVQAPAIRIEPLAGPPLDPSEYDLVCVTSANGVAALFARLAAGGRDARSLSGARVAAIGSGTAAALGEHGIHADIVPERSVAESLVQALEHVPFERALIARARVARDVLPDALRARGGHVDVLDLYETAAEPIPEPTRRAALAADYITFTSSSTVRFFLDAASGAGGADADVPHVPPNADADDTRRAPAVAGRIVSIGPVTSGELRAHGLEPDVEAERHDIDGVVDALCADAAGRPGGGGGP
jgi:uroporphyrinogen III methyltransferase/synthase